MALLLYALGKSRGEYYSNLIEPLEVPLAFPLFLCETPWIQCIGAHGIDHRCTECCGSIPPCVHRAHILKGLESRSTGSYFSIVIYSNFSLYKSYSNSITKLILAWVRTVVQVELHPLRGPVIPSPLLYSPRGPEARRSTEFNSTNVIIYWPPSWALHYITKFGGGRLFRVRAP